MRDSDGGLQGLLSQREVGGLVLEQHFAADAMQFGVEAAMTGALGRRKRVVENGKRPIDITRALFDFSKRNPDEPIEHYKILIAQKLRAAAHVLEPADRL